MGTGAVQDIEFYEAVSVYTRKEGKEWVAYVDPFSVGGDGSTKQKAIRSALANLNALFRSLVEEKQLRGSDVEVFCPLDDDLKRGADVDRFLICAVYAVERPKRMVGLPRVKRLSEPAAQKIFSTSATVSVVPSATSLLTRA